MSVRAAVIGSPVAHSLSPAIHRAAFSALGVDWTYDAVECGADDLGPFVDTVRGGGFGGLSVTQTCRARGLSCSGREAPHGRWPWRSRAAARQ